MDEELASMMSFSCGRTFLGNTKSRRPRENSGPATDACRITDYDDAKWETAREHGNRHEERHAKDRGVELLCCYTYQ